MDKILQPLLTSPKLHLYLEEIRKVIEQEQKMRLEFYKWLTPSIKAEFINGKIIVHSPAKARHILANQNLLVLIKAYTTKHQLGQVFAEKALVCLTRNDYEPDICFFGKEKSVKLKSDQMQFPSPDFVIEIISPSTEKADRTTKFEDYAAHGVKEYWLIDPGEADEFVEQYILNEPHEYQLVFKSDNGIIKSQVIEGFEIPVEAIFDEELNWKVAQQIYAA